jgi:Family of unknown function (DUF6011)
MKQKVLFDNIQLHDKLRNGKKYDSKTYEAKAGDVYCKMCGKPLTDTKSRQLGVGPECYQRALIAHEINNKNKGLL